MIESVMRVQKRPLRRVSINSVTFIGLQEGVSQAKFLVNLIPGREVPSHSNFYSRVSETRPVSSVVFVKNVYATGHHCKITESEYMERESICIFQETFNVSFTYVQDLKQPVWCFQNFFSKNIYILHNRV